MTDKPKGDYYTGPQAGDFAAAAEPFALFEAWFADAKAHEPNDPNAMALATVDAAGMPNVRMMLLKGVDPAGHAGARLRVLHQLRERQGPGAVGLRARRRSASTGSRCAGRCACAGTSRW